MSDGSTRLRALGCNASFVASTVVTPDGLTIAVQDWGRGAAQRDVLLIHGFSQSHLSWLKQVSARLAEEFRLVTYDLRGHGASDKPLDPHYYREAERWSAEIDAVIRGMKLDRPVLVGWSYAGRIMLDYLKCRGDGDLDGIVFVNATTKMDVSVVGPAAALMRPMTQQRSTDDIESTRAFLCACTAQPLPTEALQFMLDFNLRVPSAIRANLSGRVADYDSVLRAVAVPVLALHGADDRICLPAMAAYTTAAVRNGHSIVYDGVGHMPFWEAPERFNADLADFLRQLKRSN